MKIITAIAIVFGSLFAGYAFANYTQDLATSTLVAYTTMGFVERFEWFDDVCYVWQYNSTGSGTISCVKKSN